ncbi:MAG: hypothetical protein ABIM49_02290 [candidate division WOR-3 bacterium]
MKWKGIFKNNPLKYIYSVHIETPFENLFYEDKTFEEIKDIIFNLL